MDNIVWHIEPTSKCILECPLCDRTKFYETFKKRELHEININHLLNFINGVPCKILLCGNNGDPIYHSQFHQLCRKLKEIDCELKITTNGSNRNKKWWEELSTILTKKDTVTFSIDGLQDTNQIYRINSKFSSIMNGFNIIKGSVKTVWKFIVFKHNQHQIEQAKKMSKELGFDKFQLEKSDRWWDKKLMPDEQYVNTSYKHQLRSINDDIENAIIKPFCLVNNRPRNLLYIDSAGNFYPCCWTGLYSWRHKDIFDPRKKKFNIENNTIKSILNNSEVKDFFNKIKNYDSASKCCKVYCGVSNG